MEPEVPPPPPPPWRSLPPFCAGGRAVAPLGLQTLAALAQTGRSAGKAHRVGAQLHEHRDSSRTWCGKGRLAEDLAAIAGQLAWRLKAICRWLERSNLKDVLSEAGAPDLGIVRAEPNAAPAGQMTGARYIVLGTVSSTTPTGDTAQASKFGLRRLSPPEGSRWKPRITWRSTSVSSDSTTVRWWDADTWKGEATSTAEAREQGGSLLPLAAGALLWPEHGAARSGAHRAAGHL